MQWEVYSWSCNNLLCGLGTRLRGLLGQSFIIILTKYHWSIPTGKMVSLWNWRDVFECRAGEKLRLPLVPAQVLAAIDRDPSGKSCFAAWQEGVPAVRALPSCFERCRTSCAGETSEPVRWPAGEEGRAFVSGTDAWHQKLPTWRLKLALIASNWK